MFNSIDGYLEAHAAFLRRLALSPLGDASVQAYEHQHALVQALGEYLAAPSETVNAQLLSLTTIRPLPTTARMGAL